MSFRNAALLVSGRDTGRGGEQRLSEIQPPGLFGSHLYKRNNDKAWGKLDFHFHSLSWDMIGTRATRNMMPTVELYQ